MYEYFYLCLIIGFAGFTQGFSGFGAVIVSLPCLSLFIPIKTVVPLVNLMSCVMNLILVIQLRRHLQWPKILPLLLGSLPGIPLGVYYLKHVAPWMLELLLGAVLISFPFYSRYTNPDKRRLQPIWAYLAGFGSGCLGGSLGTNGPPIIIYAALQPWDKDELKATLVGFFFHRPSCGSRITSLHRPGHDRSDQNDFLVSALPGFGSIRRVFLVHENRVRKL
jgi:uncharacterized membrane protein YfcA